MAEYLFSSMVGADAKWQASSAGISAATGLPASVEAVHVMDEKGVDIRPHRSRMVTENMLVQAAQIIVMTSAHASLITRLFPQVSGRVFPLKSFCTARDNVDIMDPIGSSVNVYRQTRDEIENALLDLAGFLNKNNG